jgi:hypothetical protein
MRLECIIVNALMRPAKVRLQRNGVPQIWIFKAQARCGEALDAGRHLRRSRRIGRGDLRESYLGHSLQAP